MTHPAKAPLLAGRIRIDVQRADEPPASELVAIRDGLLREPPEIAPKYFYDDRGSLLFEAISRTPEYYQTRTEMALLEAIADEVVATTGADELVELGSGAATKARILLDAMQRAGRLRTYVPFDVNEAIVRRDAAHLVVAYPELRVHGVIGEFTRHLGHIPDGDRRLVILLGGTIGNFEFAAARDFLAQVGREMTPRDHLLLGTDLIKDVARLEAAYNDAGGITAEFNRNALRVINVRAEADFDPGAFGHRAFYDVTAHRIEMRLRALRDQVISLRALELTIALPEGKEIRTEISVKFDRGLVDELLEASGFVARDWFTDPSELFALTLARPRSDTG